MNKNTHQKKQKYSKVGCIVWALKNLWRLDKRFVFFIFAAVPFAVVIPLVNSYFPKVLIDNMSAGASFQRLALLTLVFTFALILLNLLNSYIHSRCEARRYYPTSVYQTEMSAFKDYQTDYENTENQEFKKVNGYVWGDACHGDCAMEYVWKDLSKTLIDITGIAAYASFLIILNPVILVVTTIVSAASYFFTRMQQVN